jgi:plastocyanin
MKRLKAHSAHIGGLLVVMSFLFAGPGIGFAQDATPSAGVTDSHPAHIHAGTCSELGDVVFPLTDITAGHMMPGATPEDMGMMGHDMGTPMAGDDMMMNGMVETSVTDVEASLSDILADDHAINVHESMENIGNYIACGDVTGDVVDDELEIELKELNDSGYSGYAFLADNGDGTTTVTVNLTSSGANAATPEAGDAGAADTAEAVQVIIKDFAYNPDPVTISVGQSVTWTNEDSAPHTATAQDRDVLQSGTLNQGDSYTQTFDTPGTYEYFCEFHSNMKGVIIVE